MKTLKSIFVVVVSLVSSQSWAQEKASVYFIRPARDIGRAHNVFIDGKFAYRVKSGQYVVSELETGERKFSSRLNGKKPDDYRQPTILLLKPEKKHYLLLVDIFNGFFSVPTVVEVTESYAQSLMEKMSERRGGELSTASSKSRENF